MSCRNQRRPRRTPTVLPARSSASQKLSCSVPVRPLLPAAPTLVLNPTVFSASLGSRRMDLSNNTASSTARRDRRATLRSCMNLHADHSEQGSRLPKTRIGIYVLTPTTSLIAPPEPKPSVRRPHRPTVYGPRLRVLPSLPGFTISSEPSRYETAVGECFADFGWPNSMHPNHPRPPNPPPPDE